MRPLHIILALLIAAVWGVNFIAMKMAVTDLPPMLTSVLRFAGVFICLLPFFKPAPGLMKPLLSVAIVLGVVHFALMYWAVSIAGGVSAMAIAAQLSVPFATILAVLFLGETIGWKRISGIFLSFLGVVVIAFEPEVFSYFDGVMIMTLAAFMYAVSVVLMRHLRTVPAMTVQAWIALAGLIGAIILSLLFESNQVEAVQNASSYAWFGVLFTIVGASLIGHGGANVLLRKYEVAKVSPYFLTSPVFSLIGGALVLNETVTFKMVLGAAVTIAGILIVTLRNSKVRQDRLVASDGGQ